VGCLGPNSVDRVLAWIDEGIHRLEGEEATPREAVGRVLADDIRAVRPVPPSDSAALDGYAVQAYQTLGASSYNPIELPLIVVAAGDALSEGMDAVVPLEHGEPDPAGRVVVVEAVAPGGNVDRRGTAVAAGAALISRGTQLAPRHIGILAAACVTRLAVIRRPRVGILLAGSRRPGAEGDSDGPMLCALVERDGGIVLDLAAVDRSRSALSDALTAGGFDIALVVGGTGPGRDDMAAAALAAAGELAIHGVALRPGETAGLGRNAGGIPVMLLPGTPAACLWSYELFAGRAIRRLAGRDAGLPYRSHIMTTTQKIVSSIGITEICPVRCRPRGGVAPIASFTEIGLMAAVDADGFVIVPETSEGYPAGTPVDVYLYDDR
jgi:molybdopterin molybdotransferase